MEDESARDRLSEALRLLWEERGKPEREEDDDVLGVLIRMILAQATTKQNASQAFGTLLDRFHGDWRLIARAEVDVVADAITVGGLSNRKAPRIQKLLRRAKEDFGDYTLEPVREMSTGEALKYVQGFDGVGPTTARFALMYASGFDVFPINGGIRRVLERLGVLDGSESDRAAHQKAQVLLEEGEAYAAHMTLVRHARSTCTSRDPDCSACPARIVCAFAQEAR